MQFKVSVCLTLPAVVAVVLSTCVPTSAAQAALETPYEKSMAAVVASAGKKSDHDRLWNLFEINWKYQMNEFPEWSTSVGEAGRNGRWTDDSKVTIDRRKRELDAPLKALQSIDRSRLNEQDRLNYDIFKYGVESSIEGRQFPGELLPISQLDGVQQNPALTLAQNPTGTVKDYEDILERLRGIPAVVDQNIALMKEGIEKKITPPKITLRNVPAQISSQIVDDPQKSPLYEPFKNFPADIPASEQKRIASAASGIIRDSVVPSYKKFLDFFIKDYQPACRESISFTALPEGKRWYAHKVRANTTLNLTADQIHEIGLSEVKRLRAEMEALMAKSEFKGSFPEFLQHLRTDRQFFYDNTKDLLIGYRDIAKRIDPELVKQFGKLPRLQYGVEPVPAFSEKSQPTAYYRSGNLSPGRAGTFFANTYDLKSRPKWEMEPLTLHEAVPGHHLQISLAQEMESLPDFRKHGGFNAYVEGWGLYAESLGGELGMYKDVYSRFGQLSFDMWRSIRLVLDTGIHAKGWTRQQAIDFFKANSGKPLHDIEVEVDRYIVWPGQALAYKLGQLRIKQLKEKSRSELGDKFDVRAFHDHVLGLGAVPLDVLSEQTREWIGKKRSTN